MVQRYKSRFRITTNGGQCISCGNCSAQCEMGIDVVGMPNGNKTLCGRRVWGVASVRRFAHVVC